MKYAPPESVESSESSSLDSAHVSALGFALADENWLKLVARYRCDDRLGALGEYVIDAELGRGGQGVVYRGVQPRTGRVVAIKRMRAGGVGPGDFSARFMREVRTAAALSHPNIVTVFGAEQIDGGLLMAMEYVEGVPVDRWAAGALDRSLADSRRRPPPSVRQLLLLFVKICDAIGHAHQRGVIHRDIKPSNVLVDKHDEPHVLDFGLARVTSDDEHDATAPLTTWFVGTPAYAAPEQFGEQDAAVDIRSDVYSLGCMLFESLTGRSWFGEHTALADVVDALRRREPPRPSSLRRELNREIDAIVLKAISLRKDDRYQSADALADDIRRYINGQVVLAHTPTTFYQLRKILRRRRGYVISAAALLVTILGGSIASTTLYFKATQARIVAEHNEHTAIKEAKYHRETADALLAMIRNATQYAAGRRSVSIQRMAGWIAAPLSDPRFTGRSDVAFDLHLAAGQLLVGARQYTAALDHFVCARALAVSAFGADSPQAINAWEAEANTLLRLDRLDEALMAARVALDSVVRTNGPQSYPAQRLLGSVAAVQMAHGDFDDAERILREIIEIRDRTRAEPNLRGESRMNLGRLLVLTEQLLEARELFLDALDILREDPNHNRNLDGQLWVDLGGLELRQARAAEAERYYRQAVDLRLSRQGLKYFRTMEALHGHGNALHALGRYAEASECYEKALVWLETASPPDALDLSALRFRYGVALTAAGRDQEGRLPILLAVSRGQDRAQGNPEWDALAGHVIELARNGGWRIDSTLATQLGRYSWLATGVEQRAPDDGSADVPADRIGDDGHASLRVR